MEYLMTYGWAILIIAIVLGALFSMGVFSSANLSPKAKPGSCEVFRTSAVVNLEGECQGLEPQYVAKFDGTSSYVNVPYSSALNPGSAITVSAWIKLSALPPSGAYLRVLDSGAGWPSENYYFFEDPTSNKMSFSANEVDSPDTIALSADTWYYIVGVYDGSYVRVYLNGTQQGGGTAATGAMNNHVGPLTIGSANGANYYNGIISNVQIYNTSLSQSEITALYDEGIGGAPIYLQGLIGWWPLN
jgi:hypothetical protein